MARSTAQQLATYQSRYRELAALGARSIMCNPRKQRNLVYVNSELDALVVNDYYLRKSRVRTPRPGGPPLRKFSFTPWSRATPSSPAKESTDVPDTGR